MDFHSHRKLLQDALLESPDNLTLRRHLGDLYLKHGMPADAEAIYRESLEMFPQSEDLKRGLAASYFEQGKISTALVIVEELASRAKPAAATLLLHARILARRGEVATARDIYARALQLDPSLKDQDFEDSLRVKAGSEPKPPAKPEPDLEEGFEESDENDFEEPIPATPMPARDPAQFEMERPRINFDDVGGMDQVKDQIRIKIIEPMRQPEIYKAFGKAIGGGILMYGPPGCGKTHLARATAGQVEAGFFSVGIHDVLDMWLGGSEQKLHQLFTQARRSTPTVLFFDEVDALGANRSDMRQGAGRHLINQFLVELDGATTSNDGVLILAATNAPWHLDPAFRRPGRFDRIIFVPPPDQIGRSAIIRTMLRGKPVSNIDCDAIAKKTVDFSGADLKAVIDRAIEVKLTQAFKTGIQPLTTKDLLEAARQVQPSTREWFSTARNYALYSNESGTYDDVLAYLQKR